MSELITRLNCSNCKFVSPSKTTPMKKDELNANGGVKDASPEARVRARKIRLITLPGTIKVTEAHWCTNPEVDQWVTQHMWCRMWEATGTIHPK
jgi:hypothetical protein